MPSSPIHRLTGPPGPLAASTIVCGDPTAALALWDAHGRDPAQLCPACWGGRAPCTCGPGVPVCPSCRDWNRQHRGRPTHLPALRTEKAFQEWLRQQALAAGWLYYHTTDSRTSPAGFVDTVCVRDGRLVLAELKRPGKSPTPAQQQWLDALGQVERCETYLWYPGDLDTILEVLR